MAIAAIGGLISSTALSLVYVPAVFIVMDDLEQWLGAKLRRMIGAPTPVAQSE